MNLMASKVSMRPLGMHTHNDMGTLLVMIACSSLVRLGYTQTSTLVANNASYCAQEHARAPVMTCDRNTCARVILCLGIGVCACLYSYS